MHLVVTTKGRLSAHSVRNVFATKLVRVDRIKLLICDMDGTLYPGLGSELLARLFLKNILRGLDPDALAQFEHAYFELMLERERIASTGRQVYADLVKGTIVAGGNLETSHLSVVEDEPVIIKAALISIGMSSRLTDRLYDEAKLDYLRRTGIVHVGINDEVYRLMNLFAGIPKVVATNSSIIAAEGVLKLLGIYHSFEKIYELCRKPAGLIEVLDAMLTRWGVDPGEALYLGDSYGLEIAVARAMGIPAVFVSREANEATFKGLVLGQDSAKQPALVVTTSVNNVFAYLNG